MKKTTVTKAEPVRQLLMRQLAINCRHDVCKHSKEKSRKPILNK